MSSNTRTPDNTQAVHESSTQGTDQDDQTDTDTDEARIEAGSHSPGTAGSMPIYHKIDDPFVDQLPIHNLSPPTEWNEIDTMPNRSPMMNTFSTSTLNSITAYLHLIPLYLAVNNTVLKQSETLLVYSLNHFLHADDDLCAEILKFIRQDYTQIDLTGVQSIISQQVAVQECVYEAPAWWLDKAKRVRSEWQDFMQGVCCRMMQAGTLRPDGTVVGAEV